MWTVLPVMALPLFVTLLVTSVPMYAGTPLVGGGLLPPVVGQLLPQAAGGVLVGRLTVPAKPLSAGGAVPPERLFSCDQLSAHHVTVVVGVAALTVRSPRVNAPRLGNANTVAVVLSLDAL